MREAIITSRKINFFDGCYRFNLNDLRLALDMALKFYISLPKALKLKVRKLWGLITWESYLAKLVEGVSLLPLPPSHLE